jgi:hypothetical protein
MTISLIATTSEEMLKAIEDVRTANTVVTAATDLAQKARDDWHLAEAASRHASAVLEQASRRLWDLILGEAPSKAT